MRSGLGVLSARALVSLRDTAQDLVGVKDRDIED
jgi:hypothetical protein